MTAQELTVGWIAGGLISMLVAGGCASRSPEAPATTDRGGGEAVVTFVMPERFTDVELADKSRAASRAEVLPRFERELRATAARELPAGIRLELRITDLDQAGWMRPTRDGRRVRVVRDGQPARVAFDYTVTDAAGATLESGRKNLNRLPSESAATVNRDPQTTRLLNEMMADWMRTLARKWPAPQ